MKIKILIDNGKDVHDLYVHTGIQRSIDFRIIEIELTEKQKDLINLDKGEGVRSICLQEFGNG